ncbi:MAG: hydrogenase iron-sulfur subunit [Deltaproteobacteria bacterium]|nr:hydrogenase iron-sulfur subunit [Deltaproteobacteria bacterium]
MSSEFEPKIVAFLCNWCSYKGADLAGTSRFKYPPNVRIIRVMCSDSIDPVYVLKALLDGLDGVLIGGCHLGDCHYQNGNYKAMRRIEVLKSILRQVGIDEDRVWLRWISASEGNLFRDTINQMVKEIKAKGPNPMKKPWEMWQKTMGVWKPSALKNQYKMSNAK